MMRGCVHQGLDVSCRYMIHYFHTNASCGIHPQQMTLDEDKQAQVQTRSASLKPTLGAFE